jgi:hypothetical protein
MAATIGKVAAVFTASTGGLTAGMRQAGSSMKSLSADVAGLRSSMRTLTAVAGAQLFTQVAGAAMSAGQSLLAMGQSAAGTIDSTSKLSARLGMTYGELSGLAYAGSLADVSMESIGKAATKADIAFVRASQGSATARAAFDAIGISVDQLQGKSPAERFQAISDAIGGMPNEAERAAAAVRIFGKAGADLMPLFAGGAGAVGEATAEAQAFGLALTNAQGQDVEAMNDAFTRAAAAIQGITTQVTAYLAPSIQGVADTFTQLVGDAGGATIGQRIGDGILDGAEFLAGIGDYLIANFGSVFEYLSGVGEQWGGVFDFASKVGNVLTIAGNGIELALRGVVYLFSGLVEQAISVVSMIPGAGSALEGVAASVKAFNNELQAGAERNVAAIQGNFADLLGGNGEKTGQAIAGPLTKAFQEFRATSRDSAAAVDVAKKQNISALVEPAGPNSAALTAIDSRSKEGVAEMFRLMRGDGADIQAQQLAVQERMADGIEEMAGNEMEVLSMGY